MDAFTGTWVANLAKSRRDPNHQFHSAELRFDISGDAVSITHNGVNMSGKQESGTTLLHADGNAHAVSPQAPGVVAVTKWIGPRVLETVATKDDQVVGRGTYEVSDDSKTLTATVAGIDGRGAAFEQVIVFDRAPIRP